MTKSENGNNRAMSRRKFLQFGGTAALTVLLIVGVVLLVRERKKKLR